MFLESILIKDEDNKIIKVITAILKFVVVLDTIFYTSKVESSLNYLRCMLLGKYDCFALMYVTDLVTFDHNNMNF